ncbi:MAG: sulfotransferase [Pseudomonadota bacterium]
MPARLAKNHGLKYVTTKRDNISLERFPDFFIAGPQRTGTTWLYKNLVTHPQIFLSRRKEIYYFNMLQLPHDRHFKSTDLGWYLSNFRDSPIQYFNKWRFCKKTYGKSYRPLVRGEATASYAAMREEIIDEVINLKPDIKVIIMVRDPIQRGWSHAKKDLVKRTKLSSTDEVDPAEVEKFLLHHYQVRCGNYTHSIDAWSSRLPEGHVLVRRFDDVSNDPVQLLRDIYEFLGVEYDPMYVQNAQKRINPTHAETIPERYREILHNTFADELKRLDERYGYRWD